MWSGNQSNSEEGILLLEPKYMHPCNHILDDPKASYLGGQPSYYPNDLFHNKSNDNHTQTLNPLKNRPTCDVCGETMYLILQLYAPLEENDLDRSLYVFGCNSASCVNQTFGKEENEKNESLIGKRFSVGGGGVIKCFRSQSQQTLDNIVLEKRVEPSKKISSGWGDDTDDSMGSSSDGDSVGISMDDLSPDEEHRL